MIISLETATYLDRVTKAIDSGKGEIPLTDTCPECGLKCDTWTRANDDAHLVMQVTSDNYAVLLGCEGYWVIDPKLVGMPGNMWQDWREGPLGEELQPVCILEPASDEE